MKILFTGGGSGGHFYPIIAVAQELNRLIKENKLVTAKLYYMSDSPYNEGLLYENGIVFKKNQAGKMRRYFSLLNLLDFVKTIWGLVTSVWKVFSIYPDVVFSKGGYASFPAVFAARILRIPVFVHESDAVPGKTNLWAGKFAVRVAVADREAVKFFPAGKVAFTGNPVRNELKSPMSQGAKEFLKLEDNVPVILVLGGSLGAQVINEGIIDALPQLLERYQVIHQTGAANFDTTKRMAEVVLRGSTHTSRYKPFEYLDVLPMKMAAGASNLVISRAGSTIFEIALWGLPSIIIPITDSNGDHQRKNAFAYARSGAAMVVEEANLSANILISEVDRIMGDPILQQKMKEAAKKFSDSLAAEKIAKEILEIALSHED